ncbi:MAG: tetratricopeptide repeat protein, partial [Gammaproteobacteria bacterium]|nr:tetratricopeptide repeat protein [Gammaproteobacteria bacterium]
VTPLPQAAPNIDNLLPGVAPYIMRGAGPRPGPALAAARALFPNVGAMRGQIVLVTDGVDDADDVLPHRDPAFPISIVGVGTAEGGPIPLDFRGVPGRFLTDEAGATVHTRLDAARLADLARRAYGEYRTLGAGAAPWTWRDTGRRAPGAQPDRTFDTWHDAGFWLVLPVLALVCLGFRRGVLVGLACMLIAPVGHAESPAEPSAERAIPSSLGLWRRPDQRAYDLLRAGRAEAAARVFEDPRWAAVAQFRAGDVEGAANRFRGDHTPTGYYNLGNALARLGALEAAVAAYERVLATAPDHADARHNRDLVAGLLAQGAREDGADGGRRGSPEGLGAAPDDSPAARSDPDAGTRGADGDTGAASPTDAAPDPPSSDARIRWLDSVPDDPGGLLRRKFRYETNQRLRQGDYRSRERGPTW